MAILTPVVTALLAALVVTARQYLQVKIAAVQHQELRNWITSLVMSAEQQFKDVGSNPAKLEYVTEQAWIYVQSLGLSLSREQVRALIEAAVRAMLSETTITATATVSTSGPVEGQDMMLPAAVQSGGPLG